MKNQTSKTQEDKIIEQALEILMGRLKIGGEALTSPNSVRNYLKLKLAEQEREVFAAIFMNAQHQVIAYEELFYGTIDSASVYPREIVKTALRHNAAAVILAHNHPSGNPEPSQADIQITTKIKDALNLLDIRVLDHLIVGSSDTVSLAERGLM